MSIAYIKSSSAESSIALYIHRVRRRWWCRQQNRRRKHHHHHQARWCWAMGLAALAKAVFHGAERPCTEDIQRRIGRNSTTLRCLNMQRIVGSERIIQCFSPFLHEFLRLERSHPLAWAHLGYLALVSWRFRSATTPAGPPVPTPPSCAVSFCWA